MNIRRKYNVVFLGLVLLVATIGFSCARDFSAPAGDGDTPSAVGQSSGEVTFPDETIERNVRLKLNLQSGDSILTAELEKVTVFSTALELYVKDLQGMGLFVNLIELDMTQNKIVDLSPLSSLSNLTRLNLTQNDIVDLSPLASLTKLDYLHLQDNEINDLSALASLTELTELNIQENQITDVSALASLTKLEVLRLNTNQISDISALGALPNLKMLEFSKNQVTDISPLLESGLGAGTTIRLWGEKLDVNSVDVVIPQLKAAGVKVQY